MGKSAKVKYQDEAIAHDLSLKVSPFAVTLKHTTGFTALVKQFVFSYVKDDIVYYDTATTWTHANGLRCKKRKFRVHPQVLDRLHERVYNRWFFHDGTLLIPIQMAKYSDLLDHFYFTEDLDPRYRTTTALLLPETQFIRKKPLVAMRPLSVSWGAPLIHVPLRHAQTA